MVVRLHGGKNDQLGLHGYGKRFATNWLEVENCFPTAVGRILFSREADDSSKYLYMTEERAERFEQAKAAKVAANKSRSEPVRVRGNGPHTRFRVHFKRGIRKMVHANSQRFKGLGEMITPHNHKRIGYKQVKRLRGVAQTDVNGRAGNSLSQSLCYCTSHFSFQITMAEMSTRMVTVETGVTSTLEDRLNESTCPWQKRWPTCRFKAWLSIRTALTSVMTSSKRSNGLTFCHAFHICLQTWWIYCLSFWHN